MITGGRIFQLATSKGGVPKLPVRQARVGELGLSGDVQKHTKIHGGPDRAVCLFSLEVIQALQAEGHPIYPGSTGENVTLSGIAWSELAAGSRLRLGDEVIVELTRTATPCRNIAESFLRHDYKRLGVENQMRWYARVIYKGTIAVGMTAELLLRGWD